MLVKEDKTFSDESIQ